MTLDEFTQAYIDCCFEETIEEGPASGGGYGPIGDDYSVEDIDPKSLKQIEADCQRFQAEHRQDIATWSSHVWSDSPAEMAGRCFFESRNDWVGGFQGRDWSEPQATRLAAASKEYLKTETHISDAGVVSIKKSE
jgi:hypothetical protein